VSLNDFSARYCPHCSARLDFFQDYLPDECPFCKGVIKYDDCGGTIKGKRKGIELKPIVLFILVLAAFFLITYLWGGR